jgi:hypothetical protein
MRREFGGERRLTERGNRRDDQLGVIDGAREIVADRIENRRVVARCIGDLDARFVA